MRHVREEIKTRVKELERANADYWAISDKLNNQIELQTCVGEYQKLLESLNSVYIFKRPWPPQAPQQHYQALPPLLLGYRENYKKLIDSCIKELEDNKRELQAIQDALNKARHRHGSTMKLQ